MHGGRRQGAAKRLLDLAIALPLLVLTAPVVGLLILMVRVRLGSPALFRQVRPGLEESPFVLLKLRTMNEDRDTSGRLKPDEQRLTRLGRFLRSTSLDELPTLINVVRGELSLVGPRPLLTEYLDRYSPDQRRRHEVKPGITGWAQIHGRNALSWESKFELDLWYVDNWSLALDLLILWRTVGQVVRRRGISAEGHATAPKFEGASPENRNEA